MTDASILVPHLSLPLRLGAGATFATVEQDSDDEVLQSVGVVLNTTIGARVELPEYGIPDVVFADMIDTGGIVDALQEWEPRAQVDVTDTIDSVDDLLRHVSVQVEDESD